MAPNPSSLECVSQVLLLCLVDLTVIKGLDLMGYLFFVTYFHVPFLLSM